MDVGAVVEWLVELVVDLSDELDEQLAATMSTVNAAMPAATRRAVAVEPVHGWPRVMGSVGPLAEGRRSCIAPWLGEWTTISRYG